MTALRACIPAALAAVALLVPTDAWAWGPATHVLLGSHVLANLALLPVALREVLAAYPFEFLYGNLSADVTLGKKYVQYRCHRWTTGFLLLRQAESDRLKSFALGYLTHLAADTVAHNEFVPRKLLVTSSTRNVGHAYWEYRFDALLEARHLDLAREVVLGDHTVPDELLERVLTQAIFSFRTHKRIYRQIVDVSYAERWQAVFGRVVAQSRWELPEDEVERYLVATRGRVMDFLQHGARSGVCTLDPMGREKILLAKRLRRSTLRDVRRETPVIGRASGRRRAIAGVADAVFGVPSPSGGDSLAVAPAGSELLAQPSAHGASGSTIIGASPHAGAAPHAALMNPNVAQSPALVTDLTRRAGESSPSPVQAGARAELIAEAFWRIFEGDVLAAETFAVAANTPSSNIRLE